MRGGCTFTGKRCCVFIHNFQGCRPLATACVHEGAPAWMPDDHHHSSPRELSVFLSPLCRHSVSEYTNGRAKNFHTCAHTLTHTCTCKQKSHTCIHNHAHVSTYTCTHACKCTDTRIRSHAHVCARVLLRKLNRPLRWTSNLTLLSPRSPSLSSKSTATQPSSLTSTTAQGRWRTWCWWCTTTHDSE